MKTNSCKAAISNKAIAMLTEVAVQRNVTLNHKMIKLLCVMDGNIMYDYSKRKLKRLMFTYY